MKNIMVTGGAGFIGANFVLHMLESYKNYNIIVYDKLTYAGNLENLLTVKDDPRYAFVQGDIADSQMVDATVEKYEIDTIVNFAAETHVDRSILNPDAFITTGVYGTYALLEAARKFKLERYHQISTDEVYGHIPDGYSSQEGDPLVPRSPYSASKASGDLFVHSYFITYGVPVTITRGSNNIGPFQYPEKVVPLFATNAMDGDPLPVYGDGRQQREYQYVRDHCEAIDVVLQRGEIGETYNIGTGREITNLQMVEILLETLELPRDLIRFVEDRPGHDRRYSLDISKMKSLGWEPRHSPEEAVSKTVEWYRDNEWWWRKIKDGSFREYYERQYGERLRQANQ